MKFHPPYPRIRKTIKWGKYGGAAVTVLLVVVWMGSNGRMLWWSSSDGHALVVDRGLLQIEYPPLPNGRHLKAGWHAQRVFDGLFWWPLPRRDFGFSNFVIPFWYLVAASLTGTASAWSLDVFANRRARFKPHRCPKCNYDRTGLAPGVVCPECGSKPT